MKWLLILVILFGAVDAAPSAQESLGSKIKKILAPTPTPNPGRKHRKHSTKKSMPTPSPAASSKRKKASPSASPTPKSKSKRKKASPTPTPSESPSATETPPASPAESPEAGRGKKGWPNVSLSPDAIEGYENYPPKARADKTRSGLQLWFGRSRERRHGLFRFHLLRP
jgi:hypothetical protein